MKYRVLTGTELTVSRICLGTWTLGSRVSEDESIRMINYALDKGINFFDTADSYFNGASEDVLGKALKDKRKDVVIASKVGYLPDDTTTLSPGHIYASVESSLKRLNTDYLDICYFHAPDYKVPFEDSLEAINNLAVQGKIRYIGLSNYAAWQLCKAHWICEKRNFKAPAVAQSIYNLLVRSIEQELVPCCRDLGVGMTVFNPLAAGLLTGKHKKESVPAAGSRFDWNKKYYNRYWKDSFFDAVDSLSKTADKAGKTLIELALQWLCSQEHIDSIIVGASNMGQLEENLSSWDGRLDRDTLDAIDAVWDDIRKNVCPYNR